jgi:hypothetical protein
MNNNFIDACAFKLVERLDRIAILNEDKFEYNIEVKVKGIQQVSYTFTASSKSTSNNVFVFGTGVTLVDTFLDVAASIDNSCKLWNYKEK